MNRMPCSCVTRALRLHSHLPAQLGKRSPPPLSHTSQPSSPLSQPRTSGAAVVGGCPCVRAAPGRRHCAGNILHRRGAHYPTLAGAAGFTAASLLQERAGLSGDVLLSDPGNTSNGRIAGLGELLEDGNGPSVVGVHAELRPRFDRRSPLDPSMRVMLANIVQPIVKRIVRPSHTFV